MVIFKLFLVFIIGIKNDLIDTHYKIQTVFGFYNTFLVFKIGIENDLIDTQYKNQKRFEYYHILKKEDYHLYVGLLQSRWYQVNVVNSLTFIFEWICFFVFYPYDTFRIHISYFLHWFLVFKQQVESFLKSLSRDRLFFNLIPFCQLCIY